MDFILRLLEPEGPPALLATRFQNHSARVIATLRLVLAAVFLAALYFDPNQPARSTTFAYLIIGIYLVLAAALFRIAWVSWWYDFRLSAPVYVLDICVFALSVYFTEGPQHEFNSPFLAFFVVLMISSTLRWNWRVTGLAAGVIIVIYLAAGLALTISGYDFDNQVFFRRLSYMIVIGLAFIFFGMQLEGSMAASRNAEPAEGDVLEAALRLAIHQLGANRAAIVWEEGDEPPIASILFNGRCQYISAPALSEEPDLTTRLFSRPRGRQLFQLSGRRRVYSGSFSNRSLLAERAGIEEGLSTGLVTPRDGRLQLLAGGIPDLALDEIERIKQVAHAVVELIEGRRLAELERNRAIVQTREALARDLHDSVAQALAGTSFGLEALRQSLPENAQESQRLIANLKQSLRSEQANIRSMIERLRIEPDDGRQVDLGIELGRVIHENKRRWGVGITDAFQPRVLVPAPLAFECNQILREAISNAVRHGKARNMQVGLTGNEDELTMDIGNDGKPMAAELIEERPWTIRERVDRLGGSLHLDSSSGQTRLIMTFPRGRRRDENSPR